MIRLTINNHHEELPDERREEAMQRFWVARQSGDASAKIEVIEGADPADDEPDPEPPEPPPATAVTPSCARLSVSSRAQERIALHEEWLKESGFSLAPPLFAPGTRVTALGDANFKLERSRVESMPEFADAATHVIEDIRREDRKDLRVRLREVSMNEGGKLIVRGEEMGVEAPAFHQLASLGGFGMGARYLARHCSPELRAMNVNEQFAASSPRRSVILRTRIDRSGARRVFAGVTPTYAVVDTDEVLASVSPALAEARTEMRYDGAGLAATALWMPETIVDLAAGDVFKAGVRLQTDDTGRGRIRISAVVFRNRCLNLIVIGVGEVETVSKVHRGDPDRIVASIVEGVDEARGLIDRFLESWGHARTSHVNVGETLDTWVKRRKLDVPGLRDKAVLRAEVERALHSEPGDSVADLINAVTRSAHESPLWNQTQREALERQAGVLLMAAA